MITYDIVISHVLANTQTPKSEVRVLDTPINIKMNTSLIKLWVVITVADFLVYGTNKKFHCIGHRYLNNNLKFLKNKPNGIIKTNQKYF